MFTGVGECMHKSSLRLFFLQVAARSVCLFIGLFKTGQKKKLIVIQRDYYDKNTNKYTNEMHHTFMRKATIT